LSSIHVSIFDLKIMVKVGLGLTLETIMFDPHSPVEIFNALHSLNPNIVYEAGQLDATDYLDAEDILTLGMSCRGGHLEAKMSY